MIYDPLSEETLQECCERRYETKIIIDCSASVVERKRKFLFFQAASHLSSNSWCCAAGTQISLGKNNLVKFYLLHRDSHCNATIICFMSLEGWKPVWLPPFHHYHSLQRGIWFFLSALPHRQGEIHQIAFLNLHIQICVCATNNLHHIFFFSAAVAWVWCFSSCRLPLSVGLQRHPHPQDVLPAPQKPYSLPAAGSLHIWVWVGCIDTVTVFKNTITETSKWESATCKYSTL